MRRASRADDAEGFVLPVVLCIGAAVLTLAVAWFEASTVQLRRGAHLMERISAFQAADAALEMCTQRLLVHARDRQGDDAGLAIPNTWRDATAFDRADAWQPLPHWPGTAEPPRCVVEASVAPVNSDARAYLITARGSGPRNATPVWLQSQIMIGAGKVTERRWRELAGAPR